MLMKTLVLAGDYWHACSIVEPLLPLLFEHPVDVALTEHPADFLTSDCDVLMLLKDPIENNQIPTPAWCDEAWTTRLLARIEDGMGLLAMHAALADLPETHPLSQLFGSVFVSHPAPCEVTFRPVAAHPALAGVTPFTFPEPDEHYQMRMLPGAEATLLANTESTHGAQPGLWVRKLGKGRVAMLTPGHTAAHLTYPPYIRLMRNLLDWLAQA